MIKINLLIEDDYIETFMRNLPKDKVTVIEESFNDNKKILAKTLENYKNNDDAFHPMNESLKNISQWLEEKKSV